MRFEEEYIYPDEKGDLCSPEEKGTRRAIMPYQIELLDGIAGLIKSLRAFSQDEQDLLLECAKDGFVPSRTAKRLGVPRYKIEKLIKTMLKFGNSKGDKSL